MVLYRRAIDWHMGVPFEFSVERGLKLRGLPVTGNAKLTVDAASRSVHVDLNLAAARRARRRQRGDVAPGLRQRRRGRRHQGHRGIGAHRTLRVRDLALAYADAAGTPHFEGQGTLVLPSPASPTVTARLGFGAGDGYFHAGGDVDKINRPLAYGVFLQRIRFDITINPVRLSGGIGVSAGPRLFGREAVSVDGDFTYENSNPDRYAISGSAQIADIPLASGSVSYQTDGRFDMSGQASF